MAHQSSGAVATASAGSKYVSRVTGGTYNLGIFYPGSVELRIGRYGEDFGEIFRLVSRPEPGWEGRLDASIRSLQDLERGIDGIIRYLPIGTIAIYRPNALNGTQNQIPKEVGIADEIIGGNLEKVVAIVELWLKRKLEIEQ